jgi:hypothetical protein
MTRMSISGNSAEWGGGLYFNDCDVLLENCLIDDNLAEFGGGILCGGSRSAFVNLTITGNRATSFSGAIKLAGRNLLECRNSIVWANRSPYGSSLGVSHADTVHLYYSNLDSLSGRWINWSYPECGVLFWHEGTISADPLFCDSSNANYLLKTGSPCIDSGDPRPFFNDFESPDFSGIAQWPARGTCRNDMGVYGGGVYLLSGQSDRTVPATCSLRQNYPNPFNSSTTVEFDLPEPGYVRLDIYNVRGQLVRTVVDAGMDAGRHKTVWNGENSVGQPVASGLYLCRMQAGKFDMWKKLILAK